MSLIPVTPWTVLMAIRYGLGRMTYANSDAANLAQTHWHALGPAAQRTIREDAARLTGLEAHPWAWLTEDAP